MSTSREQLASARSFLFVPGHRSDRFDKAAASGAEVVIIDLEDAVAEEDKQRARADVAAWLERGNEAVVRINPPGTPWFESDFETALDRGCPIMLPKSDNISQLADVARRAQGRALLIPLIETAAGIEHAADVCATVGTLRVAFGNADLAAELGIAHDDYGALAYARSKLVVASAAAGLIPPIDGVTLSTEDEAAVTADVAHARRFGFTAKLCIHPRQVPHVIDGFAPSESDCEWARTIVEATGAATQVDGHMVDKPVLERAHRILAESHRRTDEAQTSGVCGRDAEPVHVPEPPEPEENDATEQNNSEGTSR